MIVDDEDPTIPDVIELDGWLRDTDEKTWGVLRYTTYETFYKAALVIWRARGSPDIRT